MEQTTPERVEQLWASVHPNALPALDPDFLHHVKLHELIDDVHRASHTSTAGPKIVPRDESSVHAAFDADETRPLRVHVADDEKLPPPIVSTAADTFAEYTCRQRMPDVVRRILKDNGQQDDAPAHVARMRRNLQALLDDMPSGRVPCHMHRSSSASDVSVEKAALIMAYDREWDAFLSQICGEQDEQGPAWLDVAPGIVMEITWYRQILEATEFFEPSSPLFEWDPYHAQKHEELEVALEQARNTSTFLTEAITTTVDTQRMFAELLHASLWGNGGDLSLHPLEAMQHAPHHHHHHHHDRDDEHEDDDDEAARRRASKEPSYVVPEDGRVNETMRSRLTAESQDMAKSVEEQAAQVQEHVDEQQQQQDAERTADGIDEFELVQANAALRSRVLADDSEALWSFLSSHRSTRTHRTMLTVHIVLDNTGAELVNDLALASMLLTSRVARRVVLHAKMHPTFVGDTTVNDVEETIRIMLRQSEHTPTLRMALHLQRFIDARSLVVEANMFWTLPRLFWDMPRSLVDRLRNRRPDSSEYDPALVIFKGDANYRRLVGDRRWPHDTAFADVVEYLGVPVAALRTSKAEVMVGIDAERAAAAKDADEHWLTSGRWGVIQFARPQHAVADFARRESVVTKHAVHDEL